MSAGGSNELAANRNGPKDGTIVDLWRDGERLCDYQWCQLAPDNGFFECAGRSGYGCVRDATHWILPPEAPK